MRRTLFVVVLAGALLIGAPASAYSSPGVPQGFVSDFANVISDTAQAQLEQALGDFQASTTHEVAIVTVPSLNGEFLEKYATQLFAEWGIGTDSGDNGVLVFIAIREKKLRIEVGYGLEGALPDTTVAAITSEMIPYLAVEDYDNALWVGVQRVLAATSGEFVGVPNSTSRMPDVQSLLVVLFFIVALMQWSVAVLSRSKSYWAGGVIGALAGIVLSMLMGWGILAGLALLLVLAAVGALFDYGVSHAYHESTLSGATPPWWTGGTTGIGGFSGGGGGFGGFGGGRSGGGGASGSW